MSYETVDEVEQEYRLYQAIVADFEGRGEAWTTDDSGDTLARAAAAVAMQHMLKSKPTGARASVQQDWTLDLPVQQQSVLMLATRGPDGMRKDHPAKEVVRAYRACVMNAATTGRPLEGDSNDSFMSNWALSNQTTWGVTAQMYFDHVDEVPHHYHLHLLHGAQVLGYKYPDETIRGRWMDFYLSSVDDMHLSPEPEDEMDDRLDDFGASVGGLNGHRR